MAARIEEINVKLSADMNYQVDELEKHIKREDARTEAKLVEMDRKFIANKKEFE